MYIWSLLVLLLAVIQVLKSETKPGVTLNSENKWTELAFVLSGLFFILMVGFALAFYCFYRRMKAKLLEVNNVKLLHGRTPISEDEDTTSPLEILYDTKWDLKKHSFCIDESKILGCGEFGIVYKGKMSKVSCDVAFKCLKSEGNMTQLTSLVSELKLLAYIGQHRNIIKFLGAYTKEINKGILYVATEYCALGSLKSYLRSNKEQFQKCCVVTSYCDQSNTLEDKIFELTDSSTFTIKSLLNWCAEISMAMDYLYSKKVVHRDLAARNVLLTEDLRTKVTDFGLSRKIYTSGEYLKKGDDPLPWKWLALESLLTNVFNIKTDIWAYGILLWEIFSFGETPYPGISASTEFVVELENGLRNRKPKYASKELYEVMVKCWNSDPDLRPSFSSLCLLFQNALQLSSFRVNVDDLRPMGQLECENVEYIQLEDPITGDTSINDVTKCLISLSKSITNLDQILNGLIEIQIISEEESRIIKCELTDSRQNFRLLSLLFQKGWTTSNPIFLDILRNTNNAHCVDEIDRISIALDTKDQSLGNARNEFILQENIPSNKNRSNHNCIVFFSNGVHVSKICVGLMCLGIFTSLVICTFILFLNSTVWINTDPENVGNTSSIEIKKEELLKFLKNISGSKTISGLYLGSSNKEVAIAEVQRIAGVLPGILYTHMPKYSAGVGAWQKFVDNRIADWNNHYLIHIIYFYDGHPLNDILENGNETSWIDLIEERGERNKLWKKSLNRLAPFLLQLQTAGVVTIVNLLPYINHKIFRWGGRGGLEGSMKLFQITKDYLTQHYGLTSLIWNWSLTGTGDMTRLEDYWPGNNYVDVATLVMGGTKELSGTDYQKLLNVAGDKPIAMDVIWSVPSPEILARQTKWAWFTVDHYVLTNKEYNSEENTKRTFNSRSVINQETNQLFS